MLFNNNNYVFKQYAENKIHFTKIVNPQVCMKYVSSFTMLAIFKR